MSAEMGNGGECGTSPTGSLKAGMGNMLIFKVLEVGFMDWKKINPVEFYYSGWQNELDMGRKTPTNPTLTFLVLLCVLEE